MRSYKNNIHTVAINAYYIIRIDLLMNNLLDHFICTVCFTPNVHQVVDKVQMNLGVKQTVQLKCSGKYIILHKYNQLFWSSTVRASLERKTDKFCNAHELTSLMHNAV